MHPTPELTFTFTMLALTAILVAIGAFLHHRRVLTGPRPWIGWIALCCVPLVVSIVHARLG